MVFIFVGSTNDSYSCNLLGFNKSKRLYITQDHDEALARMESVELLKTESVPSLLILS